MGFIVTGYVQQRVHHLDGAIVVSLGVDGAQVRHAVESLPRGLKGWYVELFTHFSQWWQVRCLLDWLLSSKSLSRR